MRSHFVRPRGWMRKDRDYLVFERGPFFMNLAFILALVPEGALPPDLRKLLQDLMQAGKENSIKPFVNLHDAARKLAWKYHNTTDDKYAAAFLMLIDTFSGVFVAEAKTPDEYTKTRRKS